MDYIHNKERELEQDIKKMSIDDLLYLDMNPNYYVYNKLKPQIEQIQNQYKQVRQKQENLQYINKKKQNENMKETLRLKNEIEQLNSHINELLIEKNKCNTKFSKNDFLALLDNELKKIDNPESCFSKLKDKNINSKEFQKEFTNLGKGQNYYYYKLIYDRIKNDENL